MRNKNNNQGDDMKPLSLEQILNKHKISHLPRTILSYEQGYWFLKNNNQEIQTMICDNETGNVIMVIDHQVTIVNAGCVNFEKAN